MALVPAICTQCGAQIEVDDSHEAGICKHCGTAFITEKAINQYTTNITNNNNFAGANINIIGQDIDNVIKLAYICLEKHDMERADQYFQKAVEIKADYVPAWELKIQILKVQYSISKSIDDIEEMIFAANKIEEYSDKGIKDIFNDIYKFIITSAKEILETAIEQMSDTSRLKEAATNYYLVTQSSLVKMGKDDAKKQAIIREKSVEALKLVKYIGASYITNHIEIQKEIEDICISYIKLCSANEERKHIFGDTMSTELVNQMESELEAFKEGLPENIKENLKLNITAKKNGCYVATCVYGSYDCPEVWTLRRFRDYKLDETWHGRLFIKCYYTISPTIVKWFGKTKWFKTFWKVRLDKMVSDLNNKGIANTSYTDKY